MKFFNEYGVNRPTGLSVGSVKLNSRTGMPLQAEDSKLGSTQSEALHIAILTKALNEGTDVISKQDALE